MARVFWDTNLFIYLLEGTTPLSEAVYRLRRGMTDRGDRLFTSTLTVGEILVAPAKAGDEQLMRTYERALAPPSVRLVAFDRVAARKFAEIRSRNAIRQPDAIQLACAASANCSVFLTNDDRLSAVRVPGIEFILPLARSPI